MRQRVIVLCARSGWWPRLARRGEAGLVLAGLIAVTVPALTGGFGDITRFPALAFAPLPLLVWAAVRLGVVEHARSARRSKPAEYRHNRSDFDRWRSPWPVQGRYCPFAENVIS